MEIKERKGQLPESEIARLKAIHGDVYQLNIEDMCCYLKRPDKATLAAAETMGTSNAASCNEVLVENCWLAGDEKLREDAIYCNAIAESLTELLAVKKEALKKL
jgi:hypothetical protein